MTENTFLAITHMTENTFLIPAQTRTIFVDVNGTIYKYKLNLPKFVVYCAAHISKIWKIYAKDCEGDLCYVPLLNVNDHGNCCLSYDVKSKEEYVNALFCSKFNLDITSGMRKYIDLPNKFEPHDNVFLKKFEKQMNLFYRNWEETGIIKLVKLFES